MVHIPVPGHFSSIYNYIVDRYARSATNNNDVRNIRLHWEDLLLKINKYKKIGSNGFNLLLN